MIGQLLPNTNEMLQCILAIQILDLNTAYIIYRAMVIVSKDGVAWSICTYLLHVPELLTRSLDRYRVYVFIVQTHYLERNQDVIHQLTEIRAPSRVF
jgi:hypothetical protein